MLDSRNVPGALDDGAFAMLPGVDALASASPRAARSARSSGRTSLRLWAAGPLDAGHVRLMRPRGVKQNKGYIDKYEGNTHQSALQNMLPILSAFWDYRFLPFVLLIFKY